MADPLATVITSTSREWSALRRHINSRITDHRDRLEQTIDQRAADLARGAIAELRALLNEVEPKASPFTDMSEDRPLYS